MVSLHDHLMGGNDHHPSVFRKVSHKGWTFVLVIDGTFHQVTVVYNYATDVLTLKAS